MTKGLEIACFNLESALIAENADAQRIELCKDYTSGGLTPDFKVVKIAKDKMSIPVYVMIRPKGGDFLYSDEDYSQMKDSIAKFKTLNVDGFVFGILLENNELDVDRLSELIELAYPTSCSLHRAFDRTPNIFESLNTAIELGFKTVLTSGGKSNVIEGLENLVQLKSIAKDRIQILPGGGIRSDNIAEIDLVLQLEMYHTSAITENSDLANTDEIQLINKKLNENTF